MNIEASIIIPTYNRSAKIPELLNSLLKQKSKNFEVIVVVDGSTDNTLEVLREYESLLPKFIVIAQKNQGRACVRNRGVLEASSDLLIFYDDDMIVSDQSVFEHVLFHKQNDFSSILAGYPKEYSNEFKTDIQNYKVHISERWMSKYHSRITKMDKSNLFFSTANCSMPKHLFKSVGGFNERLTDAEDFDLAERLIASGVSVYLDRDNIALHNDQITCLGYVIRQREYAKANKKLMDSSLENNPMHKTSVPKRLVYKLFAQSWWVKAIDEERFLWIPTGIRYKFYTLVIHSLSVVYPNVKLS